MWMTIDQERLPKWPNRSAHFAWGALIVCILSCRTALGVALSASVLSGLAWEIGWFIHDRSHCSAIDWACWILGAVTAAVSVVL